MSQPEIDALNRSLIEIREERDEARARVAELEAGAANEHSLGMKHACSLLSSQVYTLDGEPLGGDDLRALCEFAAKSYGLN